MKITTVLYMDRIEPSLDFWHGRMGFDKTVEVPDGEALGFVILQHGGAELMLQTRASLAADLPALAEYARPVCGVFIEVEDFADVLRRLDGVEVVVPVRTTFYGMQEIVVREPGGNLACFAARV
jgi:catechol 2,3-dioxygenase-like lactoylglutathione lyase family enzyme